MGTMKLKKIENVKSIRSSSRHYFLRSTFPGEVITWGVMYS
jgi:hypothetical protein